MCNNFNYFNNFNKKYVHISVLHVRSWLNIIPILAWSWIGLELKLNWTCIGAASLSRRIISETITLFADEFCHWQKFIRKFFSQFYCHLQHYLIFNVLGGDRYFRTCHPLVTHTSNKLLLGAENTWWQKGDRWKSFCPPLTYWYSISVAGDNKIVKKIFL